MTPETCPTCGEILEEDAKACEACGDVFTLDAKQAKDQVREDIGAERAIAELEESGELTPEQIDAIADDDAIMAQLIEARAERSD